MIKKIRARERFALLPRAFAILATVIGLFAWAPSFAATLTVTKTADTNDGVCDTDCSLREALTVAGAGDTILFSAAADGTIVLGSALPTITQSLTLTGNGAANTVIDGNYSGTYRCFDVNPGGGTVTFSDLTVWNCSGGLINYGAAIAATSGTFNLLRSVIRGNSGRAAVYINAATATITDSTISDNASPNAVGGIFVESGTATLTGSTFSGNTGPLSALMVTFNSTATITNCTFADNSTPGFGNGTVNAGLASTLTITNSTITGSDNFGMFLGGGTAWLSNTIISGNADSNCDTSFGAGTIISNGDNLVSDGSCNLTQPTDKPNNANAQLLPLADNGGPTQTVALAAGSAAIDAGSCTNNVDQRNHMRPSGANCDIGAYEYAAVAPSIPAISGHANLNVAQSGSAISTFAISGSGPLTLTATSDNVTVLPDANIAGAAACTASGACTLTLTPILAQIGTATVTLTLSDTYGQQATASFTTNVAFTLRVTYDDNGATGGTAPPDSTDYFAGDTATVLAPGTLTRTGHVFAAWNTQPDGSGSSYAASDTFTIGNDVTLYAQWLPTFGVTYDGNGYTAGSVPVDSNVYMANDTVTVLDAGDLVRTGHTFTGWNTQPDGSGTAYAAGDTFVIDSYVTLYAQWNATTTTFTSGGGAFSFAWIGLLLAFALRRLHKEAR